MNIPDIFKSLGLFFRNKFLKKKPIDTTQISPKSEKEKYNEIINSIFTNVKSAIESWQIGISQENKEDNLIGKIPTLIMEITNQYRKVGIAHSKVSAKDYDIQTLAKADATLITEHLQSAVNGRVKGLKHDIEEQSRKKEILKEELVICQAHRKQLLEYANDNENQFSIWRAVMYISFGFILLLADIPLSLSVVSSYGLVKSFNKTDDLFTKLANTEAMLFSFGIAFCTILIKILYDEYINTRLGRWALELRKFKDDEKSLVSRERIAKLIIKVIILISLLTMLYYSGVFRESSLSGKPKNERFVSFMLLTIIIPTVSGICLSMGFNNLSNITSLKKSVQNLEKIQNRFDTIGEIQGKLIIKISQLEVFKEEWDEKKHKIDTIANQFSSSYNQGYKNGYLDEHGYDLFKQIQDFHSEVINQRFKIRHNAK